jgi:hypothetical protein
VCISFDNACLRVPVLFGCGSFAHLLFLRKKSPLRLSACLSMGTWSLIRLPHSAPSRPFPPLHACTPCTQCLSPCRVAPHHRPCRATITPVPLGGCRRFELRLSWPAEDTAAKGRSAHAGPFALDVPPGPRLAGYCSPPLGRPWALATPVSSVSDLCFKCFI